MPSIIVWFSPNDTLLVEQTAVVRVVDYGDAVVTLEVRAAPDAEPVSIGVGSEWSNIVGALQAKYHGIFVNEKYEPARRAGIELRDTEAVDVRRHSFAGVPTRGATPMRRGQPPGGAH